MSEDGTIKRPRRVLHIGKYFPPYHGGMETYLNDLMNVQHRQGLIVSAIVHSSKKSFRDSNHTVDDLDGGQYEVIAAARWLNAGYIPISPFFLITLNRIIKRFRPDVIHIHVPNASAAWLLFSPVARNIPWLIQWHSDIVTPSSGTGFKILYKAFHFFEKLLLSRAKTILPTSEAYLLSSAPLRAFRHKCSVIPLGLDIKRLPLPSTIVPYEINNDQKYQLLFIGRLATYKGLVFLIEAMRQLTDAHLWIAGDGEEREGVETAVHELGLTSRVTLMGDIDDQKKWGLIQSTDALVLPSVNRNEAFGMVLLEAGFYGLPLVTTKIKGSGTSWVASQFPRHALSDPHTSSELVSSIREVLGRRGERARTTSSPPALHLESHSKDIFQLYIGNS